MTNKSNTELPLRFITIEGGEGAGKTSLLDHLEKALRKQGFDVIRTREPGGTLFGEQIRGLLLNHGNSSETMDPKAEMLLFLAARAQHIADLIQPALQAGKVVLCDRYNDSTVAYQGAARGLGMEWARSLCNAICGAIVPDITFYLDVDPQVGLARARRTHKDNAPQGELDRIESEKLEFHQKIRKAFHEIAAQEPQRFYTIDANKPQQAVIEEALNVLSKRFKHV